MREDNHDIQTPKKENSPFPSNRKAKQMNALSKKPNHQQQKSAKKNLSSVLNSITEDDVALKVPEESIKISDSVDPEQSTLAISKASLDYDLTLVSDNALKLQHPEGSVEISPISEVSDFDENIESYIQSLNQFTSPSSVTPSTAQMTPLSCVTSVEMTPFSSPIYVSSVTCNGATTSEERDSSTEVEALVKHLRESMFQVLHSADIDPKYKKLLEALIKVVIQAICSFHEEREMVVEMFSRKIKLLLVSFVVCIVVGLLLFSDPHSSYHGPPPT